MYTLSKFIPFNKTVGAFLLLTACLGSARSATGQQKESEGERDTSTEIIFLKNGRQFQGRIVEIEPGSHVVLETEDHRQLRVLWKHIKDISSRRYSFRESVPSDRGEHERPRRREEEGAENEDAEEEETKTDLGRYGITVEGNLAKSERKRQAWLRRGGALRSFALQASVTGVLFPRRRSAPYDLPCTSDSGSLVSRRYTPPSTQDVGGGAGVGFRSGLLYLSLPTDGGSTWWAFRLGTGADISVNQISSSIPPTTLENCSKTPEVENQKTSIFLMQLPLNLGFHLGLGSGRVGHWSGVVLGLSWAPAYSYFASDGTGAGSFSYTGVELSIDFTTLEAVTEKEASKAHFRFNAFLLPPLKEEFPLLFTAGFGAVWY